MSYLSYGSVICNKGPHKGRIGYFDDDTYEGKECGVVYFGHPFFCSSYSLIPMEYLSNQITMDEILQRKEELEKQTAFRKDGKKKLELLMELEFVNTLFYEKHIQTHTLSKNGIKLFLSHSSADKAFANLLYADLKQAGCVPWLDEWNIVGGQSIPAEIEKGIDESDFLLILLSKHSVKSNWVRAEWESAIWDENKDRQVRVIPILIEECTIPRFLKFKKYIDFKENYKNGFQNLLYAIEKLT